MKQKSNILLPLLLVFSFLLNSGDAYAQDDCKQNNVSVKNFQLLDENGNPFTSSSDYQLGEEVSGKLYITLDVSNSGNAYSTKIFFNLFVDGIDTGKREVCISDRVQLTFGTSVYVIDLIWNWGNLVEVKNLFIRWSTNNKTACSELKEDGSAAQCYSNPPGFAAELPVLPDFDYESTPCDPFVRFWDLTVGGKTPYTSYYWDFAGLGTSTDKDPTFTFPGIGTYSVSLTTTDADGIANTKTKDITIPVLTLLVEATPTKYGANTGSIKIDIEGGNSTYIIDWISDPSGFSGSDSTSSNTYTIDNLCSGTYDITVTDPSGCVGNISVFIDWAATLGNPWKTFEIKFNPDNRTADISWSTETEKDSCIFMIERSIGNVSDFKEIGNIKSSGFSLLGNKYDFVDENLPPEETWIYYRIKQLDQANKLTYTKVSSLNIKGLTGKPGWNAFPNPSVYNKLHLRYDGNHHLQNENLMIKIISPYKQLSFEKNASGIMIDLEKEIEFFPAGLLIIEVTNGIHSQTLKVIKK